MRKSFKAPNTALVADLQVHYKLKDLVNLEFELNVLVPLKNAT